MHTITSTRLNKYISESGICSRREADRFIEQGNVFINGRRAVIGDRVLAGDRVRVNGREIEPRAEEALIFIALNKPVGIVSTTDSAERDNIVRFVKHSERIFPIGRLDKDSQGLIFLTSNGDLVNKILRAGNDHEKEYLVTVDRPVTDELVAGLAGGVPILGTRTKKCKVERESRFVLRMTLVQGLNRQIRRMCAYFGYEVTALERVRIMNVNLKGLPVGEWRDLTENELNTLLESIRGSSSEAAPNAVSQRARKTRPRRPAQGQPPGNTAPRGKGRGQPAGKPANRGNGRPARPAGRPGARPGNRPGGRSGPKPGGAPAKRGGRRH
ncbi:23S rRNA pseudouridine(2604) synthase RluF [Marinobacter sp. X15-166B]|uniref:23S rRNA pseudouridine(2604) synthase RluF n=1 Tax=Marinobacter sp. X15-166B TaxID=1897620 RepID=UPI00085C1F83|nr:23S rRNA pseudouridine(2604) synthase RluF [Marinobacter sp. X15-166B]OEY65520.1 23S rRNA pseudouridine synthase F [Marinobacter sp. X15-166B]